MPLTRAALAPSCVSVSPLSPTGPVPRLTDRIIELLRVEKGELVVDLYCSDLQSPQTVPEEIRRRVRMSAPGPFSERLAFLLITSGVRMIQMGALTFGRSPMESREWPILESFHDVELQRGVYELRVRYRSQHMVEFTSRFDLVLGTKPGVPPLMGSPAADAERFEMATVG